MARYRKTIRDYELAWIMSNIIERYINTIELNEQEEADGVECAPECFGMWEIIDMLRTRFDMVGLDLDVIHLKDDITGMSAARLRELYDIPKEE